MNAGRELLSTEDIDNSAPAGGDVTGDLDVTSRPTAAEDAAFGTSMSAAAVAENEAAGKLLEFERAT